MLRSSSPLPDGYLPCVNPNPYCARLGIAIPELGTVYAANRKTILFHLMVLTIVEHGGPMTLSEIAERMSAVGVTASGGGDLVLALKRSWHGSEPIYRLPDGRFALNLSSRDLDFILLVTGTRPHRGAAPDQSMTLGSEAGHVLRDPTSLRPAVVHSIPLGDSPEAVSVLDVNAHSITTWIGDANEMMPELLKGFDLLVGVQIRDLLHRVGLDPNDRQIVDLGACPKSVSLDQRGRRLTVTLEMLTRSTTGISRPLGDPKKMARYLADDERTKLTRRIESDVKALYALYSYGLLHGYVRLRWGFMDDLLPVSWGNARVPLLEEILKQSAAHGAPVDVVTGSAPSWADPWARARRGYFVALDDCNIVMRWGHEEQTFNRFDIQAIRIVEDWARRPQYTR